MIYAHMSNYRATMVRSVNKCQKIFSNPHTTPRKMTTISRCTPAHAGRGTATARAATVTGTNARLPKNSAIPAAALPARQERQTSTAAVMGHAAGEYTFLDRSHNNGPEFLFGYNETGNSGTVFHQPAGES